LGTLGQTLLGVDFTNMLTNSVKKSVKPSVSFCLFGIWCQFHQRYMRAFFVWRPFWQVFLVRFRQKALLYEKRAHKMLMKLTPAHVKAARKMLLQSTPKIGWNQTTTAKLIFLSKILNRHNLKLEFYLTMCMRPGW
jgi:hypothetical protein